jgi:hypothetical protein
MPGHVPCLALVYSVSLGSLRPATLKHEAPREIKSNQSQDMEVVSEVYATLNSLRTIGANYRMIDLVRTLVGLMSSCNGVWECRSTEKTQIFHSTNLGKGDVG